MLAIATLPSSARAMYLRTDDKLKPKIEARLRAVAQLEQTPRSQWKQTAALISSALRPRYGRGFSLKNILELHRQYRAQGAEALMLGYGREAEKPAEFVNEISRRCEKNKRVSSVELEAIAAEWLAGASIPGYGTWQAAWEKQFEGEPLPEQCPEWFIPQGWSPRQLRRSLPGRAALTFARDGFFAAHGLMPQKENDYSQLRPLERIVFDDVKTDWLVSYPGVSRACELWLLVAMDVATRTILDWVSLAAVPDDDGKRAELLEQHMKLLGGSLLTRYGIPTAYKSTWLVENAKATYREAAKTALKTLSGDQITVENTRMVNRALPSGHTERHGTPYDIKGTLERFFATFHNHGAALPGQTGSIQMLNAPAELDGQQKEHCALMKEVGELPAALVEQLSLPFLRYSEGVAALEQLFEKLNNRHNHRLQGFEKIELWRFPQDPSCHAWRPLDELRRYPAADVRLALFHSRMESPRERFERLLRQNPAPMRVPADALLPFSARVVKKVRHPAPYTIAFREGGTKWIYRGEVPELASGNGGPFFLKLLPGDVSIAYLHDATTGGLLGTLSHVAKPLVGDEAAQMAAVGEVQHFRALVTKPVMERHAAERAQHEEAKTVNAAIIAAARDGQEMIAGAAQARVETKKQTAAAKKRNQQVALQLARQALASHQHAKTP